ncbi:hypothetical protein B0H66DRAFT_258056 [Apodospora peruviana]|uniref:Rhodopsin domain-containing protein n=1 Tax=Apodospora peruviana TaxID=516989 RepID=A0AAE0I5Y1_9PEZI|nr:hypothetical protein B0H66DRAFT_258056 [Apodospora peruviana]
MNSTTSPGDSSMVIPALAHDDSGPRMVAAGFITWTIAFIFVVLRFWTRAMIVRRLGAADWCIALSLIAGAGTCVALLVEVRHGMGKHVWDVNLEVDGKPMLEAWWFSLLAYTLSLVFTKTSICLLYLTIFTIEWARKASWSLLAIVVVSNLWITISILTYCIPLQATWDLSIKASFCQSQDAFWANTGINIGTDFLIFLLPIPAVLPLRLPYRQKVLLVGVFAIGFFVCLVSLVRLAILIKAKEPSMDFTYSGTELTYWTVIEIHTAIIIACIMTLKPFAKRYFPRFLSISGNSTKDESSASSGDVPLTIGSRPLRNPPAEHRPDSWVEVSGGRRDVHGDTIPSDIEVQAGQAPDSKREVGMVEKQVVVTAQQELPVTDT